MTCFLNFRLTITNKKEFCGLPEHDKDFCMSDLAGPFIMEGKYNGAIRYIQYGIAHRGPSLCASKTTLPSLYIDIKKYMDWILENLKP